MFRSRTFHFVRKNFTETPWLGWSGGRRDATPGGRLFLSRLSRKEAARSDSAGTCPVGRGRGIPFAERASIALQQVSKGALRP
jgi:hypothetical protein